MDSALALWYYTSIRWPIRIGSEGRGR